MRPYGPTGEPDTCLWCGQQLPEETDFVDLGRRSHCCDAEVTDVAVDPESSRGRLRGYPPEHARCAECGAEPCSWRMRHETRPTGQRSGYAGGPFCTLRCGWQYGVRCASRRSRG